MANVRARFFLPRKDFPFSVDVEFPERGITAVFGSSGSGKTTFLRCIAGLENPRQGYFQIGNEIWQKDNFFLPVHKRAVGYVFQEPSLFPHLTVLENVRYGVKRALLQGNSSLDALFRLLDIERLLQRYPHSLSGGEAQRVAIARALAVNPKILLMDEPLSSLDSKRKEEIVPYFEKLHRELGIPVVYVSHSLDEVLRLADHMILLDKGGVVAEGGAYEVVTRFDLPLALAPDAQFVLNARVLSHDSEFCLTTLGFDGGSLVVPLQSVSVGSAVRVLISARDVSVTLHRQTETSILNILPARIDDVKNLEDGHVLLRLFVGNSCFLSRLSRKSFVMLGLSPGRDLFLQVKLTARILMYT
jgi:molybdate transport system ATP-binding protein